jgi:phosphohistidine phosphatase
MKNLFLIRHAKSSWDNLLLNDHERPLNNRGLRDAPIMANRLKISKISPDLIISSDALRAKQTATIFAKFFNLSDNQVHFTSLLYHSDPKQIKKLIKKLDDAYQTVFLFGHNPELNELAWENGFKEDNLPTTGCIGLSIPTPSWKNIDQMDSEIIYYDFPKNFNH